MAFLGRIFLSLIFVLSAIGKIFSWSSTNHYLNNALTDWHGHLTNMPSLVGFLDHLIPLSPFLLVVGTVFEGIGGLLLLLGIQKRLGALLLILFLIPTTVLMHPFWIVQGSEQEVQMIMFMKNLSILGGLFLFLAYAESKGGAKSGKRSKSSKSDD